MVKDDYRCILYGIQILILSLSFSFDSCYAFNEYCILTQQEVRLRVQHVEGQVNSGTPEVIIQNYPKKNLITNQI